MGLWETINWEDEFPILREWAFFNHAGVGPISARAARAMAEYARQAAAQAYVGSGWYARLKPLRQALARLIGAGGPEEIAFTPNTSTGLALVARGLPWRKGDQVVTTAVEFPANRYPWEDLKRQGVELVEVRQGDDGRIDGEDVLEAITDRTRVVALSHVQFSTGFRMNLRPISDMAHRAGGYLCVDAIQSLGALPVDVQAMGIDFLSADGHKWLLGPEGAGFFYCRQDLLEVLHPAVVGWRNVVHAQDYDHYRFELRPDAERFEPGTLNIPGLLGLAASVDLLLELGIAQVWAKLESLTDRLGTGLAAKGYTVFSPRAKAAEKSGIVSFSPPAGSPPLPAIVAALENEKIVVVTRAGRLRASPHFYNTFAQIDRLLSALP
ncbi:MAG: aminotransferase class V-fold PLP-dependent enzyme [Phycisphaeraceae bacterium]|nr:aminotransferase class V-fold PLP-dependent enzyme [Phycisphaeraceae bacterium]